MPEGSWCRHRIWFLAAHGHGVKNQLILHDGRLFWWYIGLDLSKAFDTIKWDTVWEALRRQNISDQLIWILRCLYHDQTGVVRDGAGASRQFDILSGVRQGCVLSPRLFCAALELAMSEWRAANPQGGIDPGDDMLRLLDLRFADDVLIFASTKEEVQNLLDSLVRHLAAARLMLNTSKPVALTTEAQPPSFIQVGDSHMIKVLGHTATNGLVACCAPALVRTLMWNTICSKQPRLSRNTVGCYNARNVLSKTDCAIGKQMFFQQPASLQSTDIYTGTNYKSMMFNFENLFVAFSGVHQARIGHRNGMTFCTSGICVWITGPVPLECLPGQRSVWFNTGNLLLAERWVRRPLPTNRSRGGPQQTWDMFCRYKAEQLGRCCEKCGSIGCFPTFLFHVNAATTFSERRLQVVQEVVCAYIYFSTLTWSRLRTFGLTWLALFWWYKIVVYLASARVRNG